MTRILLMISLIMVVTAKGLAETFSLVDCTTGTPPDTPFVKWLAPGVDGTKFGFESVNESWCVDYGRERIFYKKWVKKGSKKKFKIEWGNCVEWDYENAAYHKFECSEAVLIKDTSGFNLLTIEGHCSHQIGFGNDGKVYWRDPIKMKK